MLMGTSRAPALPRCNFIFSPPRLISLRKEVALGQKSWILLTALCLSVWPWRSGFASVQQGKRKGSGCKQRCWGVEMATEPCHRKPSSLLQPANVPVLCCSRTNTGRKKWNSTLRTQKCFYTVELLHTSIERTKIFCSTDPIKSIKYCYRENIRSGSILLS